MRRSQRQSALKGVSTAATIAAAALLSTGAANAGSISSTDTWAGDYQGMALPPGTLLVHDYAGYTHANDFIDPNGNSLGGSTRALTNITRLDYVTRLGSTPLILSAALPWAQPSDTSIGGVQEQSHGGFLNPVLFQTLGLVVDPKKQTYLGLSAYEYLPISAYNPNVVGNAGDPDQFVFVPQIGYTEGLTKFGVKNTFIDIVANASFHSSGNSPIANSPIGGGCPVPGLPGTWPCSATFGSMSQETSYNLKGFLRYEFMPLGNVSVGLEKSWGGQQTAINASVTAVTPFGSGTQATSNTFVIGKDDYLRGHFQATMPLSKELQVGVDLSHDFERTGGFKEDFGGEVRITKFFWPTGSAP